MMEKKMEAKMYETFRSEFGLKLEWLGKKVVDKGKSYIITGLNPRSEKFPVLTDTGTSFSAPYLIALMTKTVDKYYQKQKDAHQEQEDKMLVLARAEFAGYSSMYGLKPSDLDKQFVLDGARYQVVGINSNRRKFPIVLKNLKTGTITGYTEDAVKLCLKYPEDETARNNEYKDARTKEVAETLKSWRGKSEGFTEADLGKAFMIGGLTYTVVGAESKRGGLFIIGEKDSKKFAFKSAEVLKALGRREVVFSY